MIYSRCDDATPVSYLWAIRPSAHNALLLSPPGGKWTTAWVARNGGIVIVACDRRTWLGRAIERVKCAMSQMMR